VGRIVGDKGIAELVEAWDALKHDLPNLHMMVIGPFDERDSPPAHIVERMKADPRIHLTGFQEDMPSFYRAIDLVVQPTYREGFPTVVLEAAAMALPIVTTSVAGCVDAVVADVTGTLVPPRDPAALMTAIRRYVHDTDLRRRHGSAARERVLRDFKPERVWDAHYAEYLRLLEQRVGGVRRRRTASTNCVGPRVQPQ
jgi:glycosyltransferase involved in cell wall biosynthesis